MIKLFRNIRQKLLTENKFSKYLIYAIGEIILVVIGILIALSINNWNETNKLDREETKLLVSLHNDFEENKTRIEETIRRQKNVVAYSKELIKIMSLNDTSISQDSIARLVVVGAQSWWRTEYVTGTYDAILSSGNINILKNDSLKRFLAAFSAEVTSGFEDHEESMNYLLEFNKLAAPISHNLMHHREYETFGIVKDDQATRAAANEIITSKTYLGLLINKTIAEQHRFEYQLKIQSFVDEILSVLETEK